MTDMKKDPQWTDAGPAEELKTSPLRQLVFDRTKIALVYKDNEFSALSGVCNHVGGPLGEGKLDGDYIVCPWHHWKFHCRTGQGEPGFEDDQVPAYEVQERHGRLYVNLDPVAKRHKKPHAHHPLDRAIERAPGPVRV